MGIGLVGRKAGMTRVFTDAGETVPVTVIEVLPNRVTQVKAQDKDGYRAVQVTYGTRRPQLYSKAVNGHYAKANVAPGRALVEFRLKESDKTELSPGAELKADLFKEGQSVDVTGTVSPASVNTRVMPALRPTSPIAMKPSPKPPWQEG